MAGGETTGYRGFNIGGTREAPAKKSRLNTAVLVYENTNEKVFSVNTFTRDDHCFVVQELGSNFLCSHHQCKTRRATYVSSELTNDFACSHTEKCKQAVNAECVYELSPETIDKYQGDSSAGNFFKTRIYFGSHRPAFTARLEFFSSLKNRRSFYRLYS